MNRLEILEKSFLFDGFQINGKQVYPLSANRRAFLRSKGNTICEGKNDDPNKHEFDEIAECLYACTLTPSEIVSLTDDEWKEGLQAFTIGSEDGVIEKFSTVLLDEIERIKLALVESLGKEGSQ